MNPQIEFQKAIQLQVIRKSPVSPRNISDRDRWMSNSKIMVEFETWYNHMIKQERKAKLNKETKVSSFFHKQRYHAVKILYKYTPKRDK